MAKTVLSVQNYTAETEPERDGWYAELNRQLAALQAGTETPDWYQGGVAEHVPTDLQMEHETTVSGGYIYCKTNIFVDLP